MIIWQVCVFVLVWLVLPIGIGCALVPGENKKLLFLGGWCASLLIFHVLALLFHITLGSLRVMTAVWCILCGALAAWGYYKHRAWFTAPLTALKNAVVCAKPHGKLEAFLLAIVLIIVVGHTAFVTASTTYFCVDDGHYATYAADTWYTDLVLRTDEATGQIVPPFTTMEYMLATWPAYSSMLAVLTGIHPTIIHRTLMPIFLLPLAYGILYLLLRYFFKERKSAFLALIYYHMFVVLVTGKRSWISQEYWLLVCPWSGKAITPNISLPLVLLLLFWLEDTSDAQERRAIWYALFFACTSACCISATAFLLIPVELAVYGCFYLWRTRKWGDIPKFIACGGPAALCGLILML